MNLKEKCSAGDKSLIIDEVKPGYVDKVSFHFSLSFLWKETISFVIVQEDNRFTKVYAMLVLLCSD